MSRQNSIFGLEDISNPKFYFAHETNPSPIGGLPADRIRLHGPGRRIRTASSARHHPAGRFQPCLDPGRFLVSATRKLSDSTLPVCIDQIENRTGRIRNFENAAKGSGKHSGIFFDDSDVYKALEGISYSLINNPDPMLRRTADQWVAKIAAAQQPDGYINTYYTLTGLDKRWTDMDKHEMYCAGHMIEAGIAYLLATGDRTLLEVSTRMDRPHDE